jgi:hypothetical protein
MFLGMGIPTKITPPRTEIVPGVGLLQSFYTVCGKLPRPTNGYFYLFGS